MGAETSRWLNEPPPADWHGYVMRDRERAAERKAHAATIDFGEAIAGFERQMQAAKQVDRLEKAIRALIQSEELTAFLSIFAQTHHQRLWARWFAETGCACAVGHVHDTAHRDRALAVRQRVFAYVDEHLTDVFLPEAVGMLTAAFALLVPWQDVDSQFVSMGQGFPPRYLCFYDSGAADYEFTNFWACKLVLPELMKELRIRTFETSEEAFQIYKFLRFGRQDKKASEECRRAIREMLGVPNRKQARSTFEVARRHGACVDQRRWRAYHRWVMFRVVAAKFLQGDAHLRTCLGQVIGNVMPVEATTNDAFWGIPFGDAERRMPVHYVTGTKGEQNWLGRTVYWVARLVRHAQSCQSAVQRH